MLKMATSDNISLTKMATSDHIYLSNNAIFIITVLVSLVNINFETHCKKGLMHTTILLTQSVW